MLIRHLKDPDARRSIALVQPHTSEPRSDSTALAEVLLSVEREASFVDAVNRLAMLWMALVGANNCQIILAI